MPGTDESVKWEEQLNHSPRWVQAIVIFTRLTVTQLFIIFVVGLCILMIAKDLGYVRDRNSDKMDAILEAVKLNSEAIRSTAKISEDHQVATQQLTESMQQTTRYLCWNNGNLTKAEKSIACVK